MNLKQLEAFQAIMATGSTIGAATRMDLSQSAVSRLLTQLEDHLGFSLFLRRKGRLMATPEAEELLGQVSTLVDNLQRVQRLADELRVGRSRRSLLRVAVPTSMTHHLLPNIVAEFLREREDVVVEILTGGYDTLERAVLDRSADFAFVRLPAELPDFEVQPVLETEGVCVMPEGHPLAELSEVTVDHLREVPLVLLGRQRNLRSELDQRFREARVTPQVRVEVHSVSAACAFVAEGMGVSIINGLLARDTGGLALLIRPLRPMLAYRFGLIFRKDQPRSRLVEAFAQHMSERLRAISNDR
ncbi:LysR family transcriptional regulator [Pseudomonas sp. NPDC089401]|uniref:LysR family transcriptional regulator n=1 Tax=Pseudomonas sp. NPDC089401 TaxID=3364462 RepID=UPI00382D1AB8